MIEFICIGLGPLLKLRGVHPTPHVGTELMGFIFIERTIMSLKPHDDNTQVFGVIWMDKRRKTGVWQDVHAVGTIWATRFLSIEKNIKRCCCQPTGPGAFAQIGVPREKFEELVFLHKATADIGYIEYWALALGQFDMWFKSGILVGLLKKIYTYLQKKFMIPSLFLAWLHLKVGVHMIMRMQRASTSLDFGWFNPGPKTTTDIYIYIYLYIYIDVYILYYLRRWPIAVNIRIKRWVPNLWTLEHLELEEQLVQLRAISWVSTRHSLQPQSPLVRLNPKVRAFKGVWGQTALWLATWHGTMIENSDSILDIPVKWRCCMSILPWSPYMNWSFWEPWRIPTYG